MTIYTILRINEADYGCEELPEGEKVKVRVLLDDPDGMERTVLADDDDLYEKKLNPGSRVIITGAGTLEAAPKRILLAAVNAKYIHSNPAVMLLKAYAERFSVCPGDIAIAEYTINMQREHILADLYQRRPDVLAFSCYIWNIGYITDLIREYHLICPETAIWVGGPEVSFDAEEFLRENPEVTGVMEGEGEETFARLTEAWNGKGHKSLDETRGITVRTKSGIRRNPPSAPMNLDDLPFIYREKWLEPDTFKNRIIYYESSRGCPFSCSYCLSSIDKSVRFRSLDLVLPELQFFLDRKVPQVKFVDRTFNCGHEHAAAIWTYLRDHDNGVTNFHFEIAADLLSDAEIDLLQELRPGLVQLEIGVQSTNLQTLGEIERSQSLTHLKSVVERIHAGKNIHQHLDLIAGLPEEDLASFIRSFNDVYAMKPDQLQMGFLKLLKGSSMARRAREFGIVTSPFPPYEVLYTKWLSYADVLELKRVENVVEIYYNSFQFAETMCRLVGEFATPYAMYKCLAEFAAGRGLGEAGKSRMERFTILRDFIRAHVTDAEKHRLYDELLLLDLYLRENSKSCPSWAPDAGEGKNVFRAFYNREAEKPVRLAAYAPATAQQLGKQTHGEVFHTDIFGREDPGTETAGAGGPVYVVFNYKKRDPLNGNAEIIFVDAN